jgi:CDP-glucose 4,6-dehydratase
MTFEELKSVYTGKKVFLTGHTGFKGTWMVLLLKQLGAEVKGYSLPPIEHNALYHQVRECNWRYTKP